MEVPRNLVKDPPYTILFDVACLPIPESKRARKMNHLVFARDSVSLLDARECVLKVVFELAKFIPEKPGKVL